MTTRVPTGERPLQPPRIALEMACATSGGSLRDFFFFFDSAPLRVRSVCRLSETKSERGCSVCGPVAGAVVAEVDVVGSQTIESARF
jgi:hypothetical protein